MYSGQTRHHRTSSCDVWTVEYTNEFTPWFATLSEEQQEAKDYCDAGTPSILRFAGPDRG